ncbi:MAG: DUF58 domain-containing protein [Lentisphaerae bacterium]|nr:DUF58 domain-containing protein [Lentisphaerota bacterium]
MPEKQGISAFLKAEELHKLGRLVLLSRYVVEGNLAGAHRSPNKGASSEFADHRAYMEGDDPKHIDWKVFGRTDRYYVKRFEDETNLRVYLIIDNSNSMHYGSDTTTKFQYACHLAAALGYVVVKMRDSIGLYLFSDKIEAKVNAANSFNHLNNLLIQLQEHKPGKETKIAESLHMIAESVRKRALIVIISDLFDEPSEINLALSHFRKMHHDVIVCHTLDPMEMDLSFRRGCEFMDMETGETISADPRSLARDYQKIFQEFLEKYRSSCRAMNIDYRIARTDTHLEDFVRAYLEERRRLSK